MFPVSELKSEQNLENIVGRRDVFGQLPTGFGKSLIFSTAAMKKAYQFFWSLSPPSYNYVSMMLVPWQVSQTPRGRPSSGRTFRLKTSNIFINSPLRFLFLLMLIKTKEHTWQRSERFPRGLFTLIVKKPWIFPKQLVEGDLIWFWCAQRATWA